MRCFGLLNVAVSLEGDKPPSEVRLFKAGINATEKGEFLFDAKAADLVMTAFAAHGVDVAFDLEHLSIAPELVTGDGRNFDPDARGWCGLELRNGELWAVNIHWTKDGAARLTDKRQRYISPAFDTDDDGRITKIINIALTALPATHGTPALVAASARGKNMNPKLVALFARFDAIKAKRLAADAAVPADGGDTKGKAAAVQDAITACIAALQDAEKAFKGGDVDAIFAAMDSAGQAMDACENAINAMTGKPPDADAHAAAPPAETAARTCADTRTGDETGAQKAEITRLRAIAIDHEKMLREVQARELAAEMTERRGHVAQLVIMGRETPATAWADSAATTPKGILNTMPIQELRDRVRAFGGTPSTLAHIAPPASIDAHQINDIEISEYEINRVKATMAREKKNYAKAQFNDESKALALYADHKRQAVTGAKSQGGGLAMCRRFSRGLQRADVMASAIGRVESSDVVTLSNPVQPIQEFGASSQRALEEFRLECNATLVSLPIPWSEDIGLVLPGGSLKDTYPLAFRAIKYREKIAQNAAATTPQSVDITVQKRQFAASEQAHLRRLVKGDFAYIQVWQQAAADMARARINHRNHLVTDLLENATSGYWGSSAILATGIDGQPYFSATHKVNPFDPKMQLHGSATWSNYYASAHPMTATNLTLEKASMLLVPGPDGEELGSSATGMLVPTSLKEAARLLLTVQDLILAGDVQTSGTGKMGQVKNEHYMSGFEYIWAPQLAGSAVTANYYLFSRETIGRGLPPWVIAEDAAEEVRIWDETSDFYKNGEGWIKHESNIYVNAALLYPHGLRRVNGT